MANEKRPIDANWILGEIEHDLGCYELENVMTEDGLYVELRDVVRMVCAAPTVDAVEVVRCKDCKHREHNDALLYCGHVRGLAGSVSPDDFCSYGERRTDESK